MERIPLPCKSCGRAWSSINGKYCSTVRRFVTQDGTYAVPACNRDKLRSL